MDADSGGLVCESSTSATKNPEKRSAGVVPADHSKQTTQGCGWCLGSDSGPLPIGFNPRALHHRPQTKLPRAAAGCSSHIVRTRNVSDVYWSK